MRPAPTARRTATAVAAVFFANGAAVGSWVPHIPSIRSRLDLDLAELGVALLAVGLGGLAGSLASGAVVDLAGSRRAALLPGVLLSLTVALVAVVPSALWLGVVLFAVGTMDSVTDVAMNTQAVQLQERAGRSMINRFHAAWSLGLLAGSAVASGAAALGVGVGAHLLAAGLAESLMFVSAAPALIAMDAPRPGARRGLSLAPTALALGAAAVATAVAEGAPADWSAVFLDEVGAGRGAAGLGFVGYSAAMLAGRLAADRAVDRLGARPSLLVSLVVLAAGLAAVALAPGVALAVAGFTAMGLGAAVLFPLLYLAAASIPGVTAGAGLAAMTFGSRLGFMLGPPLIGWAASAAGLRAGLLGVVGAALILVILSFRAGGRTV